MRLCSRPLLSGFRPDRLGFRTLGSVGFAFQPFGQPQQNVVGGSSAFRRVARHPPKAVGVPAKIVRAGHDVRILSSVKAPINSGLRCKLVAGQALAIGFTPSPAHAIAFPSPAVKRTQGVTLAPASGARQRVNFF
jgi:hypothetical protein